MSRCSSSPFGSIGGSILSLPAIRYPVIRSPHPPTPRFPSSGGGEVEAFQRHVAKLLLDLAGMTGAEATLPPPLDRLLADFFDRAVKVLDVCNTVRDSVDQIRQWQKLLDIVLVALTTAASPEADRGPIGEGSIRRARKARAPRPL
uniref:Uncharacterized protein n=1 Tax=Ananas comosus var. bracteatus TaxID=296719 RepID=A0A6V7Q2M5_ANACO|nr:unnamed protein product [Ananas comosus var. bracteatus]